MDCGQIDLIGYHFGVTDDALQDRVEAHLKTCATCLGSYLALKRHLDGQRDGNVRPTDVARARLRREVARRFGVAEPRGLRAILTRPIPLYQGLAAAAFILVCTALAPKVARVGAFHAPVVAEPPVDTARTTAESVGIY